jgi:hypothetical protein
MTRENYMEWLFAVVFSIIGVCAAVFFLRLTYELLTMPRIITHTPPVVQQTQKQTDEVCAAWLFDSDLTAAKKRICGK